MSANVIASPLQSSPLMAGSGLPAFEAITAEQVSSQIPLLLDQLGSALTALEANLNTDLERAGASGEILGWEAVMQPLHHLGEQLRWSWGVVSHLVGVCNSPELREAHQSQQAAVVAFSNRAGQSQAIYRALEKLQSQHKQAGPGEAGELDATQQRILSAELRTMRLRGVGLSDGEQTAFNKASEELAHLSSDFGNHVLDATNQWTLRLTTADEVEGLPSSVLDQLAQAAGSSDPTVGPWLLGLDMPRYGPFLKYSRRRDLRALAYKAPCGSGLQRRTRQPAPDQPHPHAPR